MVVIGGRVTTVDSVSEKEDDDDEHNDGDAERR